MTYNVFGGMLNLALFISLGWGGLHIKWKKNKQCANWPSCRDAGVKDWRTWLPVERVAI